MELEYGYGGNTSVLLIVNQVIRSASRVGTVITGMPVVVDDADRIFQYPLDGDKGGIPGGLEAFAFHLPERFFDKSVSRLYIRRFRSLDLFASNIPSRIRVKNVSLLLGRKTKTLFENRPLFLPFKNQRPVYDVGVPTPSNVPTSFILST